MQISHYTYGELLTRANIKKIASLALKWGKTFQHIPTQLQFATGELAMRAYD